jgi:hypothetical protein
MERRHKGSLPPRKFPIATLASKIVRTVFLRVFLDFRRVLVDDYLPRGHTITGEYYAKLIPKVCQAIKEKRQGKLRRGVLFHQDNLATLFDGFRRF